MFQLDVSTKRPADVKSGHSGKLSDELRHQTYAVSVPPVCCVTVSMSTKFLSDLPEGSIRSGN